MPGVTSGRAFQRGSSDHLRDSPHQRLQRPVLRAGDMPEVEGEQVRVRKNARGQFSGCKVVADVVQDLVDAAELAR